VRTNKDIVTLTSLIKDITNKARTKENGKALGLSALYGNKPKDQSNQKKKGKGDKKDNKVCLYYKNLNLNHKANNCLEGNKKKREEWEKEHNKKWTPYVKWKAAQDKDKSSTSKSKDKKSKDDDNDSLFDLSATNDSHVFNTSSNKTNRWLADTSATDYITYNKFKFLTYTDIPGLQTIGIVNGDTRPEGLGTIDIQTVLSNGTTKTIRLYNCLYIPTYPINLFLCYRLL
jgi:hypothetical protein